MKTIEPLEPRRLFSVATAVSGDVLVVAGDNNANGILVTRSDTKLLVYAYQGPTVGYQHLKSFSPVAIKEVRVYGYGGSDTINVDDKVTQKLLVMGGKGADWIKAGGGAATVYGHGNWEADPANQHRPSTDDHAPDTLVTGNGAGWSAYYGGGGDDTFVTVAKANVPVHPNGPTYDGLSGDAGNDTFLLHGTRHVDAIGGAGNDRFVVGPQNQSAVVHGNGGSDTVDYATFGQAVYVKPESTTASGPLAGGARRQWVGNSTETVVGTPFNDEMRGSGAFNNLRGMGGNDTLTGNGGNDVIEGGAGNDSLTGGQANDTVFGGDGNDVIHGLGGNDVLKGDGGNDSVLAGGGNDSVYGGAGNDTLKGDDGNDALYGEDGHDHLYAGWGANLLVGGAGADYLDATNGGWFDTLFGDNADGTGGGNGWLDAAYVDRVFVNGSMYSDTLIGLESVAV